MKQKAAKPVPMIYVLIERRIALARVHDIPDIHTHAEAWKSLADGFRIQKADESAAICMENYKRYKAMPKGAYERWWITPYMCELRKI